MAEEDEGAIGADWAMGAEGAQESEGVMGAEEDKGAAIYSMLDGQDTTGIGYMAVWGFIAKCWSGGDGWMATPQTVTTTRAPAVLKTKSQPFFLKTCSRCIGNQETRSLGGQTRRTQPPSSPICSTGVDPKHQISVQALYCTRCPRSEECLWTAIAMSLKCRSSHCLHCFRP